MKKSLLCLAALVLCCLVLSDSLYGQSRTKKKDLKLNMEVFEGNKKLDPHPIHLSEQQRAFVAENNAFTLRFLKTVNEEEGSDKSFIYSPLSITYVLGMVNDAAEGATEKEIEKVLGFGESGIKEVNRFCKTLIDSLPQVDREVQLHIANSIFVNHRYQLKEPFQRDMQKYYEALAEALDFTQQESLNHINAWCNAKTKGMIPSILEKLDPAVVTYLLNAIYFKANWSMEFKKELTQQELFTTAKKQVEVPMMHQENEFRYKKNSTFAAVDIPYGNGMWSMTVMLPEEGKTTSDVIDFLVDNGLAFIGESRSCKVDLKLPRFETESSTPDLIETMKKMGIHRVFSSSLSEVPNMCSDRLFISMMLQKAHIKVNETGSEAAAVTVAAMTKCTAVPQPELPVVFHADHPFVYVIREASTGVILFVGQYTGE